MITEEKLAELRIRDEYGWYDEDPTSFMPELMDTLSALWRVAKAAKNAQSESHCKLTLELDDALAALRSEEKK